MPLLFKAKKPQTGYERGWRSLSYAGSHGILVWNDDGRIAGQEKTLHSVVCVKQQAELLSAHYGVFEYRDRRLLDIGEGLEIKNHAAFLNQHGIKADFSALTLMRGWLMGNGDFVGCDYGHHANLLRFTLETPSETAKAEGWIIIQPEKAEFIKGRAPSDAQQAMLQKLGFDDQHRRAVVPAPTQEFECMRDRYVCVTHKTEKPAIICESEASAIMMNIRAELESVYNGTLNAAIHFNMERLRGSEPAQVEKIIGDGNALIVRNAEQRERDLSGIRLTA